MTGHGDALRRPAGIPLPARSRRRRAVAAGVAASWVLLLAVTGSATGATMALVVLAALGGVSVLGLRALGLTRDHPWVQQLSARPWRNGQDVLKLALRHLPELFVITPSGSLLAPNSVELQLSPQDLRSLCERMEIGVITTSAAEVYEEHVAALGARFARPGPADVAVMADAAVPAGRYRLRQGQPVSVGAPAGEQPAFAAPAASYDAAFSAHDGNTRAEPQPPLPGGSSRLTALERSRPLVPVLRLVTGDSVTETTMSGARAGRGAVELVLPDLPTVSREHGRFTFADGRWWITNLGRNGAMINGVALAGERPLSTGDAIRWGAAPDAPVSWVEIS